MRSALSQPDACRRIAQRLRVEEGRLAMRLASVFGAREGIEFDQARERLVWRAQFLLGRGEVEAALLLLEPGLRDECRALLRDST
jgi:hypothetical protein